jgi:hypothetical protein
VTSRRDRFTGRIAGVGTTSGVRVVVGRWDRSPWGGFTDVMLAQPDGLRVLLAPSGQVAEFVAATYTFDRVELGPVAVTDVGSAWQVTAPGLVLRLATGRRRLVGRLLGVVPRRVSTAPAWAAVTDPVARVAMRGVRTRGTAGNGPPRVLRRDRPACRRRSRGHLAGEPARHADDCGARPTVRLRVDPAPSFGHVAGHNSHPLTA